jgi:ribosomal protein L30
MIKATWRKSAIGYSEDIKAGVAALGFRKLNQTRELPDNEAVRGALKNLEIWRKRSNKKHARGH